MGENRPTKEDYPENRLIQISQVIANLYEYRLLEVEKRKQTADKCFNLESSVF